MSKKVQIFNLIEAGKTNKEIVKLAETTNNYVVACRVQYNSVAPKPIYSPDQKEPQEGTMSRKVFDAIKAGVVKSGDIKRLTGSCYGVISSVRKYYFGHKPRINPWIAHAKALHTVELSELQP